MDKIRFALWFGLLASVWASYMVWVGENRPETPPAETQQREASGPTDSSAAEEESGLPAVGEDEVPAVGDTGTSVPPQSQEAAASAPRRPVTVKTDVLDLVIDLDGGDIVRADLPEYPVDKTNPDLPVRLMDYTPEHRWIFQTGLTSRRDTPAPTHQASFMADRDSYVLADGSDSLEVHLTWSGPNGLSAEKIYTFRRGQYAIDLDLVVRNNGTEPWQTRAYAQMRRLHNPAPRKYMHVDTYSFTGPVLYDGSSRSKIRFSDLIGNPVKMTAADGWVASIEHHFLGAIVPLTDEPTNYMAEAVSSDTYLLQAASPTQTVAPGAELRYPVRLFVGPKLHTQLSAAAPGRDLTLAIDYRWLTVLAQPLFYLLNFVHGFVKNWGLSIILTTLLIKLAFYKLTATSGRSMAKMRKLAPRMKALQEKHKDDRQALSQAMMELYKREKVNPAAGCLPILIQMPFFFAFYWVLIESVEMRQAPFVLWIQDLSVRDPFYILPALMAVAMLFQMRLNPTPPDPVQARVTQIMPLLFAGLVAFFPSGLALYSLTNTVSSIAQQWRINHLVSKES
jgi:YidC/Oxa1 family membrane protein insertase